MTRAILLAAASGIALTGVAQAEDTITAVSWGGAYTKSQVEAYHKPWMAKTGNKIISEDYNGGLAEVKAQVEAGNVTWDIVDVELSDAIRGCDEGLLEEIDHSKLLQTSFGRRSTHTMDRSTRRLIAHARWLTSSTRRASQASAVYVNRQKRTSKWLWLQTALQQQTSMMF